VEAAVAFIAERDLGFDVVVNFGIVTGREATQAEVDRLARSLLPEAEPLSIVATRRHAYADGRETVVHQVIVESGARDRALAEPLRLACEAWASDCAADRRLEVLDL
jgi:hypothetical protein